MAPDLWILARVLVSLAVVLLLAVVSLRYALPWLERFQGRRTERLELVEVLPLDRQHKVALVRVGGRELVLGLGSGSLTRLASWPVAEAAAPPSEPGEAPP